jgi:hypothetical protein
VTLFVLSDELKQLQAVMMEGQPHMQLVQSVALGQNLVGHCAADNKLVLVADAQQDKVPLWRWSAAAPQ